MANLLAHSNTYDFGQFHFAKTSSFEAHGISAKMIMKYVPWESFQILKVGVLALFDPTLKIYDFN
jgi:hypothetical protein